MFEHILIPLDFTDQSDAAIETSREIAALRQSRVTLLHVIETIESAPNEEVEEFYQNLDRRARRMLTRLQADLAHQQIAAEVAVTLGKRAEEIVRFAAGHDVDLIVMSSRPVDPETGTPKPWPTVSHKVAVLAPCPILLVR